MNGLGLCAGIGGLELGLEPFGVEPVCFVEHDAACQRVLRRHWPDVPIWDDVATFPGFHEVDVITAGFPCQPWSVANKYRKHTEDARWLWPAIARLVRDLRPGIIVVENVAELLGGGLGEVLRSLAPLGYSAEWDVFQAAHCGAPHKRERLFILAYTDRQLLEETQALRQRGSYPVRSGTLPFPPRPEDVQGFERWLGPQPAVRGDSDGLSDWVDQIHMLGNAVCPAQATFAFENLCARALA
jgi:DNA (cytosine-5)-methyltransferase 1